jgi:hypothetical protein
MSLPGKPFAKLGAILKQIAPTLLAGFGGPAGPLVAAIVKKSLGDPAMTDAAMQDAVTAATTTPEGLEKLKQIEADLQKAELDYQIKFAELDVQDRASARDLAEKTSALPQIGLSALFVSGYFIILVMFFYHPTGIPMSEAFTIMLGVLTAGMSQVLNYFLGSSSGSAAKTNTIAAIVKNP